MNVIALIMLLVPCETESDPVDVHKCKMAEDEGTHHSPNAQN